MTRPLAFMVEGGGYAGVKAVEQELVGLDRREGCRVGRQGSM